jgi:hypothetical protein
MPGLQENETYWSYCIAESSRFDKIKMKELQLDVRLIFGKVNKTERWEIQGYIFGKENFKSAEQVKTWLDNHMKSQIQTLLDFKAWNEYRRRVVNAYMKISNVR